MTLSKAQETFLVDLWAHEGSRELRAGAEEQPALKALADGGFIRFFPGRVGPLGVPSGSFFAQLTEAGRQYVQRTHAEGPPSP